MTVFFNTGIKLDGELLSRLRTTIAGEVITPLDNNYERARQAWNLTVDQHPALIVVPQTTVDIVKAIRFAQAHGLQIAVQATGHGVIRKADDCLLILTTNLTDVQIDASTQTAWIGAGATWRRVLHQAQAVSLAPLLGSSLDVGAVGYTLGGGMGWLARKYGLSIDSVNKFELVTADGELLCASQEENADLFWALCGGGGNFGIVTGMEIQLYPVTTVYAGNLYYQVEKAKEVLAHYREWIADAPDELTSSVVLMNYPPFPDVPEFLRGKSFVQVRGCYCGSVEKGEPLLKHWRDWQIPFVDDFKVLPFSNAALISNDPVEPLPAYSNSVWLKDISDETVDVMLRYAAPQSNPPLLMFIELRHAGGAIARMDPHSAAYGNRDAIYNLHVVGIALSPEIHGALRQCVSQLKSALGDHLHGGVYLNFMDGEEAFAAAQQAYLPENYARLGEIKIKFDPRNRFSHSYDIATKPQTG